MGKPCPLCFLPPSVGSVPIFITPQARSSLARKLHSAIRPVVCRLQHAKPRPSTSRVFSSSATALVCGTDDWTSVGVTNATTRGDRGSCTKNFDTCPLRVRNVYG